MKPVIQALLADTGLQEEITYKKYVSESYDSSLGYNVVTTSDTDITGIVVEHTKESLRLVGVASEIQVGDKAYIFEFTDCPTGMSLKDTLLDSESIAHGIKDVTNVYDIVVIVTIEGSN